MESLGRHAGVKARGAHDEGGPRDHADFKEEMKELKKKSNALKEKWSEFRNVMMVREESSILDKILKEEEEVFSVAD